MMIDRRLVEYFDWWLLALTVIAMGMGLVVLYSAVNAGVGTQQAGLFARQLAWYGFGAVVMVAVFLVNFKVYERWGHLFYLFCIILLMVVLLHGKHVGGAQRWLAVGPFTLQPSELVKLAVIVMLARHYSKVVHVEGLRLRHLVIPFFITAVPFFLIVQQPDLGTAMLLALIAGCITLYVKVQRNTLIGISAAVALTVPIVWFFLKGYQKQRILTFLNPDLDPLGAGYHIIQSKIAIGSGMLTGKGFLKGTQNTLEFLPEQHTDFIFSVLAEEWGFVGAVLVLMVFLLLITWGLQVAQRNRDPFGTILAVGITAMLTCQVFINIGMVMGLLPVVGVTLPLVSYGGSSVITTLAGIGLLLNISMRRFMFEK